MNLVFLFPIHAIQIHVGLILFLFLPMTSNIVHVLMEKNQLLIKVVTGNVTVHLDTNGMVSDKLVFQDLMKTMSCHIVLTITLRLATLVQ